MSSNKTVEAKVKVNGEDAVLHITDQSVLFGKDGRMEGFERSAIRLVTVDGDGALVAYASGSEIKSVKIEPLGAVRDLVKLGGEVPRTELDKYFEKRYQELRKTLEERLELAKQGKFRYNSSEEKQVSEDGVHELRHLVQDMFGYEREDDQYFSYRYPQFWEYRNLPEEERTAFLKTEFIGFLDEMVQHASNCRWVYPNGRIEEPHWSNYFGMWPEDYERLYLHFGLLDKPIITEKMKKDMHERAGRVELDVPTILETQPNLVVPPDYKSWF